MGLTQCKRLEIPLIKAALGSGRQPAKLLIHHCSLWGGLSGYRLGEKAGEIDAGVQGYRQEGAMGAGSLGESLFL